ncbi:hypothetical protein [Halomonas sp. 25-S5]|uniref:hypothetical protein n=1 Tax=Halomonas sp. 25-S5 TaxID=2994065 RepID=UPI00246922EA|nr:hypothetical protein [Halomonas sp. 25-S5]
MGDVINLRGQEVNVAFRYTQGDICTALRLALEHPKIAEDLEEAFSELLFGTDDPEHPEYGQDFAREMLFKILEAASGLTQEVGDV